MTNTISPEGENMSYGIQCYRGPETITADFAAVGSEAGFKDFLRLAGWMPVKDSGEAHWICPRHRAVLPGEARNNPYIADILASKNVHKSSYGPYVGRETPLVSKEPYGTRKPEPRTTVEVEVFAIPLHGALLALLVCAVGLLLHRRRRRGRMRRRTE